MPRWIHDRAKHLRRKNPGMPEAMSWAIATQQAHAAGKSPKGYGTKEGREEAKKKYDAPKSHYEQTADPSSKAKTSSVDVALLKGFSDELAKIAALKAGPLTDMRRFRKPTPINGPSPSAGTVSGHAHVVNATQIPTLPATAAGAM